MRAAVISSDGTEWVHIPCTHSVDIGYPLDRVR